MKLSKNMEWARPFIAAAAQFVDIEKVHFKGYKLRPGQTAVCDGATTRHKTHKTITIRLCWSTPNADGSHSANLLENVLVTLAHELAHTRVWEHTPHHLILTSQILGEFGRVANQLGVVDTSRPLLRKKN